MLRLSFLNNYFISFFGPSSFFSKFLFNDRYFKNALQNTGYPLPYFRSSMTNSILINCCPLPTIFVILSFQKLRCKQLIINCIASTDIIKIGIIYSHQYQFHTAHQSAHNSLCIFWHIPASLHSPPTRFPKYTIYHRYDFQ